LVDFYFPTALDICRVEDLETSRKLPEAFWGHPRSCARQRLPAGAGMLWGAPTAKMGMHNVEGPPGKGQLVHSKSDYDEAKKMVWDMFEIFWVFGWYIYSYRGFYLGAHFVQRNLGILAFWQGWCCLIEGRVEGYAETKLWGLWRYDDRHHLWLHFYPLHNPIVNLVNHYSFPARHSKNLGKTSKFHKFPWFIHISQIDSFVSCPCFPMKIPIASDIFAPR
jgi:hypothetical protein